MDCFSRQRRGVFSAQRRGTKNIAAFAIAHVNGRVPVLIGTGGTNARETIALSQHAQQNGADGIVVINPYYWKVSEANLIHYFQQVADSVTLPVILYNFRP